MATMEKEYLFVVSSAILSGLVVFSGSAFSEMGLSLYQISIFPTLFIFMLLPFILFKKECRIKKEMLPLFALYGFFSMLSCFGEFGPVVLGVPVSVTVLLLYSQPLWTVLISRLYLKEDITKEKMISVLFVLLGVIVLINPFNTDYIGPFHGILLALFGGLLLSLWIIFGRIAGLRGIHPITTKFGYYFFMLIFLFASYPIVYFFTRESAIINMSFELPLNIWIYLFLFMVFAYIINHVLYFYGAKKIPASTSGVIFLLEPVSASILASFFLGQPLTLNIIIGGALILSANYIIMRKKRKKGKPISRI